MSDASTKKKLVKRWAWRLGRIVIVAYLGLALVLALLQTQLIFPGAASQGRPEARIDAARAAQLDAEIFALKTPSGEKVAALFGRALDPFGQPHPDAKSRPTLLYFYGNGMCLADCEIEFQSFRRRGFNVMVAEYLGYGMSEGKPSEEGVYVTADACFEHLLTRADLDAKKIVPTGWSLGAGAAFHLAATRSEIPCLVAVSAFTSIDAMARKALPFLPTGAILRHHLDNDAKLRSGRIKIPIFLGHGTRDAIIPFEMSQQLTDAATAAGCTVVKYDVVGGDHNDVYDVGGTGLLDAITNFVNEHAAKGDAQSGSTR